MAFLVAIHDAPGLAAILPPAPANFVTRKGTQLELAGAPYRFGGINIHNANDSSGCRNGEA